METKDSDRIATIHDVPKSLKNEALNLIFSYPKISRDEHIAKLANSAVMQRLRAIHPDWAPLAVDYARETF